MPPDQTLLPPYAVTACTIAVEGLVQGVGFRPFVYALATKHRLSGTVRNHSGGVFIEVEGDTSSLEAFYEDLQQHSPPLARVERAIRQPTPPRHRTHFEVTGSQCGTAMELLAPPDLATCPNCLAELGNPLDRRHSYAFSTCAQCGPRFTIIESLPYDRERTSLRAFPMCRECRGEYQNPADRRFHAEATVCGVCGPQLQVADENGELIDCHDPIAFIAQSLAEGKIAAIKGLGGFHLGASMNRHEAVMELRRRKRRDEKPFAVMARDISMVEGLCTVNAAERSMLLSAESPIVLLKARADKAPLEWIAPRTSMLGVMLPHTPLHHLLLRKCTEPLVMTSGNISEEPIMTRNDEAIRELRGIADIFLIHNRDIRIRCDDSVARVAGKRRVLLRRGRGLAPAPVRMPLHCRRPILALGGQQKVTFALGRGKNAVLSQHLGDLDSYRTLQGYREALQHFQTLLDLQPEQYVHDLHPDYASTRLALELAAERGKSCLAVQHHHAHMASCMAENGLTNKVIGVIFDGAGYGLDGTIWGGEFLVGDYRSFARAGNLRPVPMPGGAKAIREPWRMALSYLRDAGESLTALPLPGQLTGQIERMIEVRINSPLTSSMGRLFDGVAALIGLRSSAAYEGQAAIELEALAEQPHTHEAYPYKIIRGDRLEVDTRPLISAVVQDARDQVSQRAIAGRFHATIIDMVSAVCRSLREENGVSQVVLSGGVFCNAILASGAAERLERDGFEVYAQSQVPPNDGGLSLGQVAVAAALQESR